MEFKCDKKLWYHFCGNIYIKPPLIWHSVFYSFIAVLKIQSVTLARLFCKFKGNEKKLKLCKIYEIAWPGSESHVVLAFIKFLSTNQMHIRGRYVRAHKEHTHCSILLGRTASWIAANSCRAICNPVRFVTTIKRRLSPS